MRTLTQIARAVACLLLVGGSVLGQDLYDTTVLRTINLTFDSPDWLDQLRANYFSQTNIAADLEMDGTVYQDVGVRIRGNTSYTALPSGSEKVSLNIDMDWMIDGQALMGYSSLNLNNGFHDPTFCREVMYNNIVSRYIPNMRANHVVVVINGQNWGVYVNVQQFNKDMLRSYFPDEDGLRIKCANNPNGPGLRYNGSSSAGYTGYEIKDDGGLADPWGALITVCDAVTNYPLSNAGAIDAVFAIDPSIWSVVWENLLTDDDSYVNKGADFMIYRDPRDGRTHLLQTDANETFTAWNWSATRNFSATNKPVLSHVLAIAEMRQRFMAHYRVAMTELDWATLEPQFTALRNLIDAAVAADPKKLYSYQLFQQNFTQTVTLPYTGPAGGTLIGLQQFVTQRASFLNGNAELIAARPIITDVAPSDSSPNPAQLVWVSARVTPNGGAIASVHLYFRGAPGVYSRVNMLDDGASGDGAAGDGVFGALVPIAALAGQKVEYYVAATAVNTWSSKVFEPALAENGPLSYTYGFGSAGVRITEFMYQGNGGEFVEFTNVTDQPIDLTGWSMDDDSAIPGTFGLSGAGMLAPGASVVVTDATPATFASQWGITGAVVLGPNTAAALGRNDQVNLYDAGGNLVDRLSYGDESYPGTIRARYASGQTCHQNIGQDDIFEWPLSGAGDGFGSWASSTGDVGTPGVNTPIACCPGDTDGDGDRDFADITAVLANFGETGAPFILGDVDGNGEVNFADVTAVVVAFGMPCP